MAERLRFTDFVDIVLARLYELDNGEGEFRDTREIAAQLKESVPDWWPDEAVKVLNDRGYVDAALAFGSAEAVITGAGRIAVEEQERDRSSTIHEYIAHPANFVLVTGSGNQVVVDSQGVAQTLGGGQARSSAPLPPIEYQVSALTQIFEHLRRSGVLRVRREEFMRLLPQLTLRDGVNPIFEPLSFPVVQEGLAELQANGLVEATDDEFLLTNPSG